MRVSTISVNTGFRQNKPRFAHEPYWPYGEHENLNMLRMFYLDYPMRYMAGIPTTVPSYQPPVSFYKDAIEHLLQSPEKYTITTYSKPDAKGKTIEMQLVAQRKDPSASIQRIIYYRGKRTEEITLKKNDGDYFTRLKFFGVPFPLIVGRDRKTMNALSQQIRALHRSVRQAESQ